MSPPPNPIGPTLGVLPRIASAIRRLRLPLRRVPRTNPDGQHDQPRRLDPVDASVLKVKPATAVTGTGAVPLLKTSNPADNFIGRRVIARTAGRFVSLLAATAGAISDQLLSPANART